MIYFMPIIVCLTWRHIYKNEWFLIFVMSSFHGYFNTSKQLKAFTVDIILTYADLNFSLYFKFAFYFDSVYYSGRQII